MRNLKILFSIKHLLPTIGNAQEIGAVAVISNSSNNVTQSQKGVYVLLTIGWEIVKINTFDTSSEVFLSIEEFSQSSKTKIVDMIYNSTLESVLVAVDNGDVININLRVDKELCLGEDGPQIIGSIPSGIQSVTLSPDTEVVLFLTKENTLIIMNGFLDSILSNTDLLSFDKGEQEMVNVGWGRKETQFHGSEGKAAAKQQSGMTNEASDEIILVDKNAYVSWRGDSSLFAINYLCPHRNFRNVKIFDKWGVLQCTSECLSGLGGVMSWRPSGNLIALTQTLPNKSVICFMEKNGLRHGEFTLPANIKVLDLSWNEESTILSAVCEDSDKGQQCVMLWTTANYHWYLKQRLDVRCAVAALCWDQLVGNMVHILLVDGTYLAFQWAWTVDHSGDDLATVAVIDGCDLKVTSFQKCVIPPPMCELNVTLPSPALQVMFAPPGSQYSESCSVYLCDGRLAFFIMDSIPQVQRVVEVRWKENVAALPSPACLSHWLWLTEDELLCTAGSQLYLFRLDQLTATVQSTIQLEKPVLSMTRECGSPRTVIQLQSGALLAYHDGSVTPLSPLPQPCITVRLAAGHTFAQTLNNHLYVDGELVADNVTSFFCLAQFLIVTLSSHQLCVTDASTNFKVEEEGRRRIERGATVVVATGHSVVLQMPRGNLETVQPRALTLVTAARLLDAGDYKAVAPLLRRQRIDLNLCVDHNPSAFLLSVPRFVAQVRDPQWLTVFLAELSDRDVTRTTYSSHYTATRSAPPIENKVKRVCGALREAMSQTPADRQYFTQPILSSLVREGRVGEAITVADSDQALAYLTLLLDTDTLYQEALAVYNLDKAVKIAGRSLKDPKEYLAYLNELRAMEPAYMRFTIDKKLQKPQSALRNLAQCAERSTECLKYVQDTGLYTLALQLFKDNHEMWQKVCVMYGDQLVKRQLYREAGLMFSQGGDVSKAVSALTKGGCWQQCLMQVAEHKYSDLQVEKLREELYSILQAQQRWSDAAELCRQVGWYERAVSCLVAGHRWEDAVYMCHVHHLRHLIDTLVKVSLLECQSRILGDIKAKTDDMERYSARLAVLRMKKETLGTEYDDLSDIKSDTSSLSSFGTSSAGSRSTKNTRKAQRKLWSLKEGNPREEPALLYTITQLVQAVELLTGEVRNLCLSMAELGLENESGQLHSAMTSGLDRVNSVRQRVWPSSAVKKAGSDADAIDPTSIDIQLNYAPPSKVSEPWKLDIYS